MKESERLTKRGSDKVAFVLANAETGQLMRYVKPNLWLHGHYKGFIVDRLAAYEETGLSPEEVEKLKAENAELRARLEKSERALKFACENNSSCCYPFKQLDENYIDECREDGSLCDKCLERWARDKAEKEESIHDD